MRDGAGSASVSEAGPVRTGAPSDVPTSDVERAAWSALERVHDPELPLDIVNLGLVYGLHVRDGAAEVDLTYTAIGCPAMEMLQEDVRAALLAIPGIESVHVESVWSPPWTKARLTPRGRAALLTYGIGL
jgi:metal-sulfur cluster biosynthetic enzyme